MIWVQKLLWIVGRGRCDVGNSLLNQLCYISSSGIVSKVILFLPTFGCVLRCLMSVNAQTSHRTRWEKNWELEPHQWTTFPRGNLTLALLCKNISKMTPVNLRSPQFPNTETRLDYVLLSTLVGKLQSH